MQVLSNQHQFNILREEVIALFIPGETIMHRFKIPFVVSDITKIVVCYYQNDHTVLERNVNSFSPDDGGTIAIVNFTQEESLLFANDSQYYIQLNVIMNDGTRCASKKIKCEAGTQYIRERVD